MQIKYGIKDNNIDVTDICLSQLKNKYSGIIFIPAGDGPRANLFTDPLFGTLKSIFVNINNIETEFNDKQVVRIDTVTNKLLNTAELDNSINAKITRIHNKLQIKYGALNDELPEQKMSVRYLKGTEKVLEIGGNIGRNSLVISHIIKGSANNMVVMECDNQIANQLTENRDINKMAFNVETSALSKRKLAQKGWDTIVCENDVLPAGYKWVNTITMDELRAKYNIEFDTLVLDCEGAFYYILMDMPEILDNIKLIIMENDYYNIDHKKYIDNILTENNFSVDYMESGGWGPCYANFFEVWVKN